MGSMAGGTKSGGGVKSSRLSASYQSNENVLRKDCGHGKELA